jgi:GT2 family glycosyltransferase
LEGLRNPRIKVRFLESNVNIAAASNEAASMAEGRYIGFLDNDDELAKHALLQTVTKIEETGAELIYSDEDFIKVDGHLDFPHFKTNYSPDLLLSHNYITHFLVLSRDLFERIGRFRSGFDGAQDYDLVLRAAENTNSIEHVTWPLYHWRMSKDSTSLDPEAKPEAHSNAKKAIQEALSRRGIDGQVENGNLPHFFRVKRSLLSQPLVSIVIPFKDKPELLRRCLATILQKSTYQNYEVVGISNGTTSQKTYELMRALEKKDERVRFMEYNIEFNFSCLVNYGVNESRGQHVVLLNNDIEIITADWIESLLEHSQRKEVAAVGGKLYYPDNRIQHAGIAIGLGGSAGHLHKHFPAAAKGYYNRLNVIQNVTAVTGAMLMIERALYEKLGGLDEDSFAIAYNDVDFCLRAMEKNYLNIFTPYVEAYHYESVSRGYETTPEKLERFTVEKENLIKRHGVILKKGDPYYNPNFDQGRDDFSLRPL